MERNGISECARLMLFVVQQESRKTALRLRTTRRICTSGNENKCINNVHKFAHKNSYTIRIRNWNALQ